MSPNDEPENLDSDPCLGRDELHGDELVFLTNCKMKMLEMMLLTSKDLLKLNERMYFKRVQHVLRADIFE